MEILFTNTEMELCWGSNKNNRFYKNLKALIPHMEYWVYGATTIKTSSSGCIVYFENSDIHFEFFELNSNSMAQKIYSQFHRKIVDNYNASHIIETENKKANYVIYTLDNGKRYNVAIYVGHTAVYAYCNSENKNEINKILDAIDYLES